MKINRYLTTICFLATCGFILTQGTTYAAGDRDEHRDRGGRHEEGRYYRHERFYPRDYYTYRKIYFAPSRVYYYYYDAYPESTYYYESEKTVPAVNPSYLPITSIANMGSQGVPDAVIISEIERTHSTYKLNSEIITYLKQNNVSDSVIDVMLNSGKKK